MCRSTADGGDD